MQGLLSDLPLMGVLELVNATRQTGVLDVQSEVPYTVAFVGGEIVGGGILDWLGVDAIQSSPLLPVEGTFEFTPRGVTGSPLSPYGHFAADWARASDEWEQVCAVIGSPSRVFRGVLPPYIGPAGRSVRDAAEGTGRPLFETAQRVAAGVREGRVEPTGDFAWSSLRLQAGRADGRSPVAAALDGRRNLGELVAGGFDVREVRGYLLTQIRAGLRFPGSGWVLRDLIWEQQHLA
ncbi:DUF4388 domain-containing protein [Deinococcus planocerae]|uniref:DUF4388 domain-containing protein n=1 Tax=Deinococcus planocerae TaxID=1737569 RepID=UPI000C7EE396|nr:DUF4388 domain-containing protein [Deinococcus planocerae]